MAVILSVIVLIIVIALFSSKVGKGSKTTTKLENNEVGAVEGYYCHSVVMSDRICMPKKCDSGYSKVQPVDSSGFKDCKKDEVCCQKISASS